MLLLQLLQCKLLLQQSCVHSKTWYGTCCACSHRSSVHAHHALASLFRLMHGPDALPHLLWIPLKVRSRVATCCCAASLRISNAAPKGSGRVPAASQCTTFNRLSLDVRRSVPKLLLSALVYLWILLDKSLHSLRYG